ncbi:MAG: MFS transporter [Thermomicrobiales bacterium]
MRAYIREVRRWDRDVKLFLLFQLLANVGFGVFNLIFNLYLYELNLREDFIGAVQAAQTICMAAAGVSLGFLLNRIGTWRSIVSGAGIFLSMLLLLSFAEREAFILVLSAISGIGLAYLFNTTMPFIMDWTRPAQRQQVAALAFSLQSLAITAGSLLGGFVPSILASASGSIAPSSVEAFRWTMVLGATLGICGIFPLFLMREARHGRPRDEATAAAIEDGPPERRQVRRDMVVFVASGGIMALGVGMVMPFYNVFLTTLGANSREIGYVYALGASARR